MQFESIELSELLKYKVVELALQVYISSGVCSVIAIACVAVHKNIIISKIRFILQFEHENVSFVFGEVKSSIKINKYFFDI